MAEDNQTSDFGPLENSEGGRDGDVDVGGLMERTSKVQSAIVSFCTRHSRSAVPATLVTRQDMHLTRI